MSDAELREQRDVLLAGWRAMIQLERHTETRAGIPALDPSACAPCMRFAVEVSLRGGSPRDNLHLRCRQTQEWQQLTWRAAELVQQLDNEETTR